MAGRLQMAPCLADRYGVRQVPFDPSTSIEDRGGATGLSGLDLAARPAGAEIAPARLGPGHGAFLVVLGRRPRACHG